jgi:hypothetical protein
LHNHGVFEAASRQQRDTRAPTFDIGIRCSRGTVGNSVHTCQHRLKIQPFLTSDVRKARQQAFQQPARRRWNFSVGQRTIVTHDHYVGKRTANVDTDSCHGSFAESFMKLAGTIILANRLCRSGPAC